MVIYMESERFPSDIPDLPIDFAANQGMFTFVHMYT